MIEENEEITRLRRAVEQLEAMLPEALRVCWWCKESLADPNEYVVEASAIAGRDDDGNTMCADCVASAEENARNDAISERNYTQGPAYGG